ncbi:keratin, type II cytoskeletal 1-like isoform X1 [Xenia sp. Carnegie-2017]|uniref:keratin, type II cytoskeletal 1-like isoform X1 n=1 Tax=Xenia sp. Carnegie-2017 TaxID=2897299 RepID=UPI001F0460CC|nr:keratin, type II cytoskeletal 1-like isoform X1 [Xenia sp. Carnegie-2017]
MEYQSEDEFGQIQWYTLKGDSVVPQKGKCQKKDKPRLNSGVVVVSDNKTAEKVPQIPGLLEFRLDQKELYVRANKSWNILPQEKEINGKFTNLQKNLEAKLNELMKKIEETDVELKKKLNSSYTELKNDMKTTDSQFKKKLTNLEADFKQKLNTKSAELNKKINDENTKIKTKLVFSKSNHKEITGVCGGQYRWLTSSTRTYNYRSNSYCDSSLSGWYRFGGSAGTMMFSGCVRGGRSRCGSYFSGHLTGGHPGVNDGIVERVVCFSHRSGSYEYCCLYRRTIKVLNCGSFYVYKLNGVPTCNSRYCSTG